MPRVTVVPVFPSDQPAPKAAPIIPNYAGVGVKSKENRPLFEVQEEQSTLGWSWHLAAMGMLLVLVFTAYGNSFQSQWVLDNKYIIELDPRTKAVTWDDISASQANPNKPGVRNIFTQDYWWPKGISGLYRPLTSFSYWMNWTLFRNGSHPTPREQVVGFHWVNLGIHWLNAILVYFLLLRLVKRFWVAFFTAALFASHPIASESVTNIIGRADMLAATTIVGGLLLYIRVTRSWGWRKVGWLAALMLLTEIGVFSKESSLAIGFVVALYDLYYRLYDRSRGIDQRNFWLVLVRSIVTATLFYFAVSSYVRVLVPWMLNLSTWPIICISVGAFAALIGMVWAIAMFAAPQRWIPIGVMMGSVVLLLLLLEAAKGDFLTMSGLDFSAIAFLVIELLFRDLWPARQIEKRTDGYWESPLNGYFPILLLPALIAMGIVTSENYASNPGRLYMLSMYGFLGIGCLAALFDFCYRTFEKTQVFNWREFIQGVARCLVIIPLFYFAVKLYLYVQVPWMNPMNPGQFTFALIGVLLGLVGMFFATALLSLRRFWLSVSVMAGSAILLIILGAFYTPLPTPAGTPVPTMFQSPKALLTGLAICTALFVAEEWIFFAVWREDQEPEESLAKWQGFWDGYFVLLPVAIMMFVVRDWVFSNTTPAEQPFLDNPLRGLGFVAARMTAFKVWGMLFWKLIWPVHLSCDYSFNQIPLFGYPGVTSWQNAQCVLWLMFLLAIVALGIWLGFKGQKAICFFIFLYLINYIPTSNWPIIIGSIMAERFMYLPLIGFVGILVIGVDMVAKRIVGRLDDRDAIIAVGPNIPPPLDTAPREMRFAMYRYVPHILLAVMVMLYGVRAFYRNWDWRTDVTLWTAARETSPMSFRSYQSLAFALFEQDAQGNIDRMIQTDEDGLRIVDPLEDKDNSSRLYLHLGMYYGIKAEMLCKPLENGQMAVTPEARQWFIKAAYILERAEPIDRAFNVVNRDRDLKRGRKIEETNDVGLAPIYGYLGLDYIRLGLVDEADQTFRYMRQLEPTDADSYFKMAVAQNAKKRLDLAAVSCIETILLDANRNDAWQLLNGIYQQINRDPVPPIMVTPNGHAQLNMNQSLVRDNLLDAYRDFVRTFRRANRMPLATTAASTAINQYKFPENVFNSLFTESLHIPEPAPPVFYKPGTKVQLKPTTQPVVSPDSTH